MKSSTRRFIPLLAAALLAVPVAVLAHDTDHNIALVRRMIEAINERDFDALEELLAPELVRHSGATPHLTVENRDQFIEFLHQDLAAVPDAQQEIDFAFAQDDLVAVRVIYSGTQTGPMGPFPASGKHVELPFIGIARIENGRIAELWVEWNALWALEQLGHFPPPSPEATGAAGTD